MRHLRAMGFVVLCTLGALGGALLAGTTAADVGPLQSRFSLRVALAGDTVDFDRGARTLRAFDRISVAGFGAADVTIKRHVLGASEP